MKKYRKKATSMMVTGMGLGIGASLVSGHSSGAVAKMGSAMKPVGSIYAAGMVMDSVKGLQKSMSYKKKKK